MAPLFASSRIGRTRDWLRHFKQPSRPPLIHPDETTENMLGHSIQRSELELIHPDENKGSFANARDFVINNAHFIDASGTKDIKIEYIPAAIPGRPAVFELLERYTCLDAIKDSSARYPPPKCHPKTRLKIRERLMRWLLHECDEWKMIWVRGSAGTGKSAVAQSFGDSCEEEKRHGASYFFSRISGRDKLETVIPTLVFQLAATIPEYCSLVGRQLANNPLLLRKSPPVQFRELIIEPFAALQRQHPRPSIVIILDGLDECKGESAQREILQLITDAVRSHPDLPLRWLIFSRPEAHLKNAFILNLLCGREELIIDDECWEDVERYVKDRLVEIKDTYSDVTPADWPLLSSLQELLDGVSGLFILASTCLNFVADPEQADPPSQLNSLLTFLRCSQGGGSINPLAALDLLYSRVLEKIPLPVYETTRRILAYMCHRNALDRYQNLDSVQILSNFLRLDQRTFYKTTRGLHSVLRIPEAKDAADSQLQFYHASFQDFLLDPNRSGKFAISEQDALTYILMLYIYWHNVDRTNFHQNDEWDFDTRHNHDSLPGLTWVSEDDQLSISEAITVFLNFALLNYPDMQLDVVNEGLFSHLHGVDFRYWEVQQMLYLARLCGLDPSNSFVRVEPSSPTDYQLLEYFDLVIKNGIAMPATFPLRYDLPKNEWIREYFIIGHGVKSVIVWRTKSPHSWLHRSYSLRCDQEPSEARISAYQGNLREILWDEAKARSEMK